MTKTYQELQAEKDIITGLVEEIHKELEYMDDSHIKELEKGMEYFCGLMDIAEGYKHAIKLTIEDQSYNHPHEGELPEQLRHLLTLLK